MTLSEYIAAYPTLSALAAEGADASIAQSINADLVPTTGEVTAHAIRQYLTLTGLLIPIEDATAMSCRGV